MPSLTRRVSQVVPSLRVGRYQFLPRAVYYPLATSVVRLLFGEIPQKRRRLPKEDPDGKLSRTEFIPSA